MSFFLIAAPLYVSATPHVRPSTLYGPDSRVEVKEAQDFRVREAARAVAALIPWTHLQFSGESQFSTVRLLGRSWGAEKNLCSSVRYSDQLSPAFCTGFLVGSDLLVTAAHCLKTQDECARVGFVFGFEIDAGSEVSSSDVYACREIVESDSRHDFSVIRLDRVAAHRKPLALDRTGGHGLSPGHALFALGHPGGISMKFSGGEVLRNSPHESKLSAALDVFGGSSGSPIFDATRGAVVGVLTEGEEDFEQQGPCWVEKRCQAGVYGQECSGEDILRSSLILRHIP